jgi:hypothetical protein
MRPQCRGHEPVEIYPASRVPAARYDVKATCRGCYPAFLFCLVDSAFEIW